MTAPNFTDETLALLPYLSAKERAELDKLLTAGSPVWSPMVDEKDPATPTPQAQAYDSLADILFFGGAAGGGKSDLVLGLATTRHKNTLVMRREHKQHKGLIRRTQEILGTRDGFNLQESTWRLPGGRSIEFGAAKDPGDEASFQGRPHDLLAFDEVTHFLRSQFEFLQAWVRTTDEGQRCRVVATGNPPTTSEGDWVREFWAPWLDDQHSSPALPGTLRWYAAIDGEDKEVADGSQIEHKGEEITPRSRSFIPSSVDDNVYLKRTGYRAVLQALPEPLRSKMLKGDFRAGREDDLAQCIPTAWVEAAIERWKMRPRPRTPQSALGIDCARGGQDEMIIAPRFDNWIDELTVVPGRAVPTSSEALSVVISKWRNGAALNIDAIGVGSSLFDALKGNGIRANALISSHGSHARDKAGVIGFINKRAEWWWRLREALDPESQQDICLPPDPKLKADLCAPRWSADYRNGIRIESKDDIHKRLGRSTDRGDAVVYAFASDNPSRRNHREVEKIGCSGYDPFQDRTR